MSTPKQEQSSQSSSPYGRSSLTYNKYLRVNELKGLQECHSKPAHHDEPLFIVIHQTYELWFKLILHEIDEALVLIAQKKLRRATFYLKRVVAILKLLVGQIHILETMTPYDFLGFRSVLNPASGFQSTQFREIEIACGLRDKQLIEHFKDDEVAFKDLSKRLDSRSLLDEFYDVLRQDGFNLPEPYAVDSSDPESLKRQEQRVQSLRKIYEHSDEYSLYFDLAEALVEIDEYLSLWRTNHATVVERVIGFKRGTGGSEGVGYLRSTLSKRCFPDLWSVRTVLEYDPNQA